LIKANRELHRRNQEKSELLLKFNEVDYATNTLKHRQEHLESQVNSLRERFGPMTQAITKINSEAMSPLESKRTSKARSQYAIFSVENKHLF